MQDRHGYWVPAMVPVVDDRDHPLMHIHALVAQGRVFVQSGVDPLWVMCTRLLQAGNPEDLEFDALVMHKLNAQCE